MFVCVTFYTSKDYHVGIVYSLETEFLILKKGYLDP